MLDIESFSKKSQLVFGIRPVIEALKSGKEVEKIYIQNGLKGELFFELKKLINEFELPYKYVPIEKLNKITTKNHQGIIAYLSEITYQNIENILPMIYEKGKSPLLLILDRITDVRNFGALIRTAECAGVDAVIVPYNDSASINADAIKTSAGALHKMNICRVKNIGSTINYLKEYGVKVIACHENGNDFYFKYDFTHPIALILGSEDSGISPKIIDICDNSIKIPIAGEIESLNVSVAAGVVLYEALKQRMIEIK